MISPMTDLPNGDISALLNRIARGDDKAAKTLYGHYFRFLYAYVRHQLPSDQAAEEVTQDVFISVFLKPQAFGGNSKFSTWLCAISKNKSVDWWRKNKEVLTADHTDESAEDDEIDPDWDFVAQLEEKQDHDALRHCVDKLPVEQKEAVFWTYFKEESVDVVAKQMGCPMGTVKSRLFNARRSLHDCMTRWIAGGRYA